MDLAANPYAGALREPGKSKRTWDAAYIRNFKDAKNGDAVQFELTNGVTAEGRVKIVEIHDGTVAYVSGELSAPETGKFFFLTPPVGGKAGNAVGVVEFPASRTAYRIEPTGANGDPELWQRRLDEVVCLDMEPVDPVKLKAAEDANPEPIIPLRPDQAPDYVPSYNSDIVSLQSYPGSPAVLLLDFAGGYTGSWGGVTYARPNVSNATIKDLWKRVAEDYMPFNINVTTDIKVFQAAPAASRQRCCFTTTPITAAGVAYVGSWNWGNDTVCWSVYCVGKPGAEVGAHEPGHTLGLAHQGQELPSGHNEYYTGQGSSQTGWAPIMGAGYYQPLTTWAKGEYQYANQQQDELLTISSANNNVHYRTDDTGSTLATSRYLEVDANYNATAQGVIEQTGDIDAFQFTTSGGTVTLTVSPVATGDWNDLATMASLADATDTVIATTNAQDQVASTITATLPAGTYTFRVTGTGKNDPVTNGFSSYASLGYYSITGTVPGARLSTRLSVAEHAANNAVVGTIPANNTNSSPLTYAITAGNTGGTFAVDNTGVVRVASNALLDYYTLAANPALYAAQFELFVTITNANDPTLTETSRRVVIAVQSLYPPMPTGLTATLDSSLRIDLAWGECYGATRYNVKRATTPGGPYTTIATPTTPDFTDSGLTNGVKYYYVVSAANTNGESYNSTEAGTLASSVAGGFESPPLGSGNFLYNPSGGGGWTFNGASPSGSGIVANGSGFSNPNAPEGIQAAFIQSTGQITQTFAGFTPGTKYTITYAAAQRGSQSGESWNVVIDGNVIKSNTPGSTNYTTYTTSFTATAALHTLSFVGTTAGDSTVFIDNVQITVASPTFSNFSFESPNIGTGSGSFRYNPSGTSWTFAGASPNGSGIVGNGSAFANPNAPDGTQAAFLQQTGTISQSVSGFTPGKTYALNYSAAQRSANLGGNSWNVKIDGTVIQSNSPGATSYFPYSTTFVATAATHTLTFAGTDLAGGDRSVFIDNVSLGLLSPMQAVPTSVAISSPANNTTFGPDSAINLTASVTANGNAINGVQFYVDQVMIGKIPTAPYVCAFGNPTTGSHTLSARVLFNNGSFADSTPVTIAIVGSTNPNLGFEIPSIGTGNYAYNATGASWTFSGSPGDGSGITANGSGFSNPNAPEGAQAAFIQKHGVITQTLAGFTPGTTYTINYSAAQRAGAFQNGGQTWDVAIDGSVIKSNAPGASTYTAYSATFTASANLHSLSFIGTDLEGGDNTVFLDNVTFNPPLTSALNLAANTSPATATDVVGGQVTFTASFNGKGPISYQWQRVSGGQVSDLIGQTSQTLTLANLQSGDAGYYRLQATNPYGVKVSDVSQLTVTSLPAPVNNVVTSFAAQTGLGSAALNFYPTWPVASGSLISGRAPSSVGSGSFANPVAVLTDGTAGRLTYGLGAPTVNQVTCGSDTARGQSVTYSLGASANGYSVSNIVVYGGWCDAGRDQQAYTVSYSTVAAPTTFVQLASVSYDPANPNSVQSATRASLSSATSDPLATNVAFVKFDFSTPASENGYVGYSEISVYGDSQEPTLIMNTTPATAVDVAGGEVTFTAACSGAGPLSYQWQKVVGGVPSNISGATSPTLTLSNLQAGDAASYQLRASNSYGAVVTTPAVLKVNSVPAPVNNVVTSLAAQTGLGGYSTFVPSWKSSSSPSLIAGLPPSGSAGNFSLNPTGGSVNSLTDGGTLAINPTSGGDSSLNYCTCGNGSGAGSSVIYTLPANIGGYALDNITVYGGWRDAGRDQQAYTVSYSTTAAPSTFVTLGTVSYNPTNPSSVQSATRATLTPANGVLASNVAAVKFDFTTPTSENGYVGYAEIAMFGVPAVSGPTLLTATAGNAQVALSWPAVSGATSYNVKRSTVSGGPYTTVGNVTTTSLTNTGLTNVTTYYYVVTAVNAAGEGAPSGQASATPMTPFDSWLAAYPSITGASRATDADPDHDGIPNGIEFLTGTSPTVPNSVAPISTTVDPSGNIVLRFKRVQAAKAYTVTVESSANLQPPYATLTIPNSATTGPPITVVDNGPAADDITVVIPSNGQPRKFARVRIAIPASP